MSPLVKMILMWCEDPRKNPLADPAKPEPDGHLENRSHRWQLTLMMEKVETVKKLIAISLLYPIDRRLKSGSRPG